MNLIEWYTNTPVHKWFVEKVWKPSWSKLVAAVYGIPSALVTVSELASRFMQDTTIQNYLAQFSIPNWVPVAIASIALLQYIASGRD